MASCYCCCLCRRAQGGAAALPCLGGMAGKTLASAAGLPCLVWRIGSVRCCFYTCACGSSRCYSWGCRRRRRAAKPPCPGRPCRPARVQLAGRRRQPPPASGSRRAAAAARHDPTGHLGTRQCAGVPGWAGQPSSSRMTGQGPLHLHSSAQHAQCSRLQVQPDAGLAGGPRRPQRQGAGMPASGQPASDGGCR